MSKLKYAFTMLAPSGVPASVGAKSCGMGVFAAVSAGATMFVPTAHATELYGTFVNANTGYSESFDVQSGPGYVDQLGSAIYDFTITNDSQGNNNLFFGDGNLKGIFGTGSNLGAGVMPAKLDFASPPVYNDSPFSLAPGTTTGSEGTTLTLSGVPEPDAWALIIAGAALAGGAVRRRRQFAAIA